MAELPYGLYENVITQQLATQLEHVVGDVLREPIDDEDAPAIFARHVATTLRQKLSRIAPDARIEMVNHLVRELHEDAAQIVAGDLVLAIAAREAAGVYRITSRPETPLSDPALLTNAPGEPSLIRELRAEIASADRIDLLCAFVKWHGVRLLDAELRSFSERGGRLRVITTTYVGVTERRAVDELARRYGAEVKISYETQATRLHAKAWLFQRDTGLHTAYVGSSNLSKSALTDGLEWNVRLSQVATPELLDKFRGTFESYWADELFRPYDPEADATRLDEALLRAGGSRRSDSQITFAHLDVRPYPHQQEILEALDAGRDLRDEHRNLVVAATGTGKTVVAALDYKRLRASVEGDLSLLFVAHRREILSQSLATYRAVLADGSFGERLGDGARPSAWRHVFASIQSLSSMGLDQLSPTQFDVVVVDEFHHAEAATYRRVLGHFQPRELLALTATPERGDGVDVRSFFGGRSAAELRLWDALAADLLCPFHYFGVSDDVDLRAVEWRRGAYSVDALDALYTGNATRASKIVREVQDKVSDVGHMRALGFCVSVSHAEYMARVFTAAGIPATSVTGDTPSDARAGAVEMLRRRELNALFSVDVFNEGLDVPEIDTILMLRPTQSATIFVQQLGRGLRRGEGKSVVTVLDFIGQHRREFRFDRRLRAMTGSTGRALVRDVKAGFPHLPAGSQVVLDEVTRQVVLENIERHTAPPTSELVSAVRDHAEPTLAGFLRVTGHDIGDVYGRSTWTALKRSAGLPTRRAGSADDRLLRRVAALIHVDDRERAHAYIRLLSDDAPSYDDLTPREQRYARMLFFSLWPDGGRFESYSAGLATLAEHAAVRDEMIELVAFGLATGTHAPRPLTPALPDATVFAHAHYRREEIVAAIDYASLRRAPRGVQGGVVYSDVMRCDAFLVTLQKSEKEYSVTTMYRDYAISPELFHWESQNATSASSPTGRRYVSHAAAGSNILVFARVRRKVEWGAAAPYLCLGLADYVAHEGDRPMAVTWRLREPLPMDVYRAAAIAH